MDPMSPASGLCGCPVSPAPGLCCSMSSALRRCVPRQWTPCHLLRVSVVFPCHPSRVPVAGCLRFEAFCSPPADPMSHTQGLVLAYLPLLGVVFPISGPQFRGEIGASVPRPRSLSLFRLSPLVVGIRCSPYRASHDAPPHPDAVSQLRALAITAQCRGACNTSPASRATSLLTKPSVLLIINNSYMCVKQYVKIAIRAYCHFISWVIIHLSPVERETTTRLRNGLILRQPPQKNQRCSRTNVSWPLDTRKDAIENEVSTCFLACKGLSIDDVGVSRDTMFQEIRLGAGFATVDFVKEKLGGLQ